VLEAEWPAPLGSAPHGRHGGPEQNARPGQGPKTVQTDTGPVDLAVPRDRHGRVAPQLGPQRQRRLEGCDAQGVSLEARGLSPRELQGPLAELYGTEGAPTLIATRTDAVVDEVRPGPARPLASGEPSLSCEALVVPSRQEGSGQTQAVSLALGIPMDGEKARLGVGLSASEGAQCGLSVFTARHKRGVPDGCSACVDGLPGLPEAREAVGPKTQVPLGLVPQGRNRLQSVPWTARRAVAADLRAMYGAAPWPDAEPALERWAERWEAQYPAIRPRWGADWDRLTVCCDDPAAIRRAVATTHAIAAWTSSLRQVRKGRRAFPPEESIIKVLSRGLQQVAKKWTQPIPEWQAALHQCVMRFGERGQV